MSDYLSKVPTLDISKFTDGDSADIKTFSEDLGNSFNQTEVVLYHGKEAYHSDDLGL